MTLLTEERTSVWQGELALVELIQPETSDVATYKFAFPSSQKPASFLPGQFNMVYLPGLGEAALSISSDPEQPTNFSHTVRHLGNVTNGLAKQQVGDQVGIRGPFGTAWPLKRYIGKDLVIACGGLGLAPLRPAIYQIIRQREQHGQVALLYGARTPQDLLFAEEYDSWRRANIQVITTVDQGAPGWPGKVGVVPGLIEGLEMAFDSAALFTCGPEVMMRYAIRAALDRGVASHNVYLSMERNMSCGMSFCGHCQIGPLLLCRDGPVVSYDAVRPFLNLEDL